MFHRACLVAPLVSLALMGNAAWSEPAAPTSPTDPAPPAGAAVPKPPAPGTQQTPPAHPAVPAAPSGTSLATPSPGTPPASPSSASAPAAQPAAPSAAAAPGSAGTTAPKPVALPSAAPPAALWPVARHPAGLLRLAQAPATAPSPSVAAAPVAPPAAPPAAPAQRTLPDPIDSPPFPFSTWAINNGSPIGESWDAPDYPMQKALFPWLKHRIKIYGWADVGANYSTSKNSNLPESYILVPNRVELDQFVLRLERMPDTVQKDHIDWGFRSSTFYGIDYRFTTSKGWVSDQLFEHNKLYGWDPVELFTMTYFPKIFDGMVLQVGRYISPPDIEAQLSPPNYLFTHSLMFTFDPYTFTGINSQLRFSKYWCAMVGVHGPNDVAPWSRASSINLELLIGWQSHSNNDSLWGGLDSIGDGKYRDEHDNEQVAILTWGHKFNQKVHMQTEGYFIWERDAALGGTAIDGPTHSYAGGGGPGPIIKGISYTEGLVNYLEVKLNKKDYLSIRNDLLNDAQGRDTGVRNWYTSHTIGISHMFGPLTTIRPEIRWEHAYEHPAYDNGAKRDQFTISADLIQKF